MRFLLLAVLAVLLCPAPAQAQTYSAWRYYIDTRSDPDVPARWRVKADVRDPSPYATYYSTGTTPHRSLGGVELQATGAPGLGSTWISLVLDLRRYDATYRGWRYFDDTIVGQWMPPIEGPRSYFFERSNPYNSFGAWWDWVPASPPGQAHLCDAHTTATDHERGYATMTVLERVGYTVRP